MSVLAMRLLNKLAAWYLRGKVQAVVVECPWQCDPFGERAGWLTGDGWYLTFGNATIYKDLGPEKNVAWPIRSRATDFEVTLDVMLAEAKKQFLNGAESILLTRDGDAIFCEPKYAEVTCP